MTSDGVSANADLCPAPSVEAQLAAQRIIEAWLSEESNDNPVLVGIEFEASERRWSVRLTGEEKDYTAVWFTLGQRTLEYETYVMPAPEENHAALYELLLRQNAGLFGCAFCIGDEDAVYLRGRTDLRDLTHADLDRILGTLYSNVERFFRPAMRIGYASRFRG